MSVRVSSSLSGVVVYGLCGVLAKVCVARVTMSLALVGLVFLVIYQVSFPTSSVHAGYGGSRVYFSGCKDRVFLPFFVVSFRVVREDNDRVLVSPYVTYGFPTFYLRDLDCLFYVFRFLLVIGVQVVFRRFFLVVLRFFSNLVYGVHAVSRGAIVAYRYGSSLSSVVKGVQVFFCGDVSRQGRVVVPYKGASIVLGVFILGLAVKVRCGFQYRAVSIRVIVVACVVLEGRG